LDVKRRKKQLHLLSQLILEFSFAKGLWSDYFRESGSMQNQKVSKSGHALNFNSPRGFYENFC
jgi:hypothetical protein